MQLDLALGRLDQDVTLMGDVGAAQLAGLDLRDLGDRQVGEQLGVVFELLRHHGGGVQPRPLVGERVAVVRVAIVAPVVPATALVPANVRRRHQQVGAAHLLHTLASGDAVPQLLSVVVHRFGFPSNHDDGNIAQKPLYVKG